MTAPTIGTQFDVGGVLLDRPFKIRRLGHVGFNVNEMDACLRFYLDLLGFRVSDVTDYTSRIPPERLADVGNPRGFFTRYGSDHHAFVLSNRRVRAAMSPNGLAHENITIGQITWQVGSLREVSDAHTWFPTQGVRVNRAGRDAPGSNWHVYMSDPDGHTIELYYGIEQIGWDGHTKPKAMYRRTSIRDGIPALPLPGESDEVQSEIAAGTDLLGGYRHVEQLPSRFDVDGILLPRPFKIVRLGPVRLFVEDVAIAERFYRETLGLTVTEAITWQGYRCVFLRANTEHHSLALYPLGLRERLGFSPHTTTMALGLQLATYRQLRDAIAFLREHGVRVDDAVPNELYPGIDYVAHAFDPDGHCIQLYYYMEQVGWDGKPRPAALRPTVTPGVWPDVVPSQPDSYGGEPFLGPWG
jgi:catechol 2,3-dioxygenase-like lactoylglutathione lyase family enzyme